MTRYLLEEKADARSCPQRSFARYWHTSARQKGACVTPTPAIVKEFSTLGTPESQKDDSRILMDMPPRPRSCVPVLPSRRSQASTPRRRINTQDSIPSCGSPLLAFTAESQNSQSPAISPTHNAWSFQRGDRSQAPTFESPSPARSAHSSVRAERGHMLLPESPTVQARRQRQEMVQVLEDFSLWHNWLRVVLDGFEAVIEILRVRCEGMVETHTATVLDVMRAARGFHKQMINGFNDLKSQHSEDVTYVNMGGTDDIDYPTMTSRSLSRKQAEAIDVLQSFMACLERLPNGAMVLDAAVEMVQTAGRPSKFPGFPAAAAPTSMQHLISTLKEVQQDLFSGFDALRLHMQDMILKPSLCSETSSWLYTSDQDADDYSARIADVGKIIDEEPNQAPFGSETSEIPTREVTEHQKSCSNSVPAKKRLKDPKCAALWGVTVEQLLMLHGEMAVDLEQYTTTHKGMMGESGFAHVCLDEDDCSCNHGGVSFYPAHQLTEEEALDLEILIDDVYLAADLIIKPRTKDSDCSWALMTNPEGLKVDVFVTHAWSQQMNELAKTLEMSLLPSNVLWLSVLSLNLHDKGASTANFLDMTKSPFCIALKSATRQVVVVDSNMSIPHRAWCMLEILQASACEVDTSYWFADLDKLDDMAKDATVFDMRDTVSCEAADANLIAEWMERSDGYDMLNMRLRKYLSGSLSLYRKLNRLNAGVPSLCKKTIGNEAAQIARLKEELDELRRLQAQLSLQRLLARSSADVETKQNIDADLLIANGSIAIVLDLVARLERRATECALDALTEEKESDRQAINDLHEKLAKQAEESSKLHEKLEEAEQEYVAAQDQLARTEDEMATLKEFVESELPKRSRRASAEHGRRSSLGS